MNHTQPGEIPPPRQCQESAPSITGFWGYVVRGESVAFFPPVFQKTQDREDCVPVAGRGRRPPALDRMLTNRTISGRDDSVPNGFSVSRRIRLRPLQSTTSASNGSFRSIAARNSPRDPGFRTINVPAAPTLTTSYSLNSLARMLGRNVLWPPTLTLLGKTIRAIPSPGRHGYVPTCRQSLDFPPYRL